MTKTFLCLLLVGGAAAGVWLYSEGKPPFGPKQNAEQPRKKESHKIEIEQKKQIANSIDTAKKNKKFSKNRTLTKKSQKINPKSNVPKINLNTTSFEDPFYHGYWDANDWSFGGKFMSCDASSTSTATFRRALKAPSLDFVLTPGTTSGFLDILLKSKSNGTTTTIRLSGVGVLVAAKRRGTRNQEIARRPANLYKKSGEKCQVKITSINGKRIIVYWNGKRLLSCKQPPEQSGQSLTIEFIASRARYNISKLRIEGQD